MHAMTKGMLPPEQDAPDSDPPAPAPGPAMPMPMVIWVHDGPVCVSIVDTEPHVPCGACQCAACRAHDPDRAVRYY